MSNDQHIIPMRYKTRMTWPQFCSETLQAICCLLSSVSVHADGRLHQQAAPELRALQQEPCWKASELQVSGGQSVAVQHVRGPSWFAEFTFRRGDAAASSMLLRSWLYQGPDNSQACAAALLMDWEASQLQVHLFSCTMHAESNALFCLLCVCVVHMLPCL